MNVRWRTILIVVLILLAFYLLWPTFRWALITENEHELRRWEVTKGAEEISLTFDKPVSLKDVERVLGAAPDHDPFLIRHGESDRHLVLTVHRGVPASLKNSLADSLRGHTIAQWQVTAKVGGPTEFRIAFDAVPEVVAIEKALEARDLLYTPRGLRRVEIVPPAEGSQEVVLKVAPGSLVSPVDQLPAWLGGVSAAASGSRQILSQQEELRLGIKMMRLKPQARLEWKRARLDQGLPLPKEPSIWRNAYTMFVRNWWLGDEDKIIRLGLDLQGGVYIVAQTDAEAVDAVFEKITRRINELGVAEPIMRRLGLNRIVVELPGFREPETALRLITQQAFMQWMLVAEKAMMTETWSPGQLRKIYDEVVSQLPAEDKDPRGRVRRYATFDNLVSGRIPDDTVLRMWFDEDPDTGEVKEVPLLLQRTEDQPCVISGDDLDRVGPGHDSDGSPAVDFVIRSTAARRFEDITDRYNERSNPIRSRGEERARGWRLAILIDDQVISAPHIRTRIGEGRGQISGRFSAQEVNQLVIQLRSGSLKAPITVLTKQALGPTLGSDSIRAGTRAGIVGLVLVVLFMGVYYRRAGAVANFSLFLNIFFLLAVMAMLRATLTLPGIAGIILTIGMAVDANVLIYERIREELAAAKRLRAAIESGFDKAFSAILDSNLTTLITAAALYVFGTGPVRGFAVTLSVGLAINMFTAVFVTRTIFEIMLLSRRFQSLPMFQFFRQPKIDFLRPFRICVIGSGILIVLGLLTFAVKHDTAFSLEFKGGKELRLVFTKPVDAQQVRGILSRRLGLPTFTLRHYGTENQLLISVGDEVLTSLKDKLVQFGEIREDPTVTMGPEGTTATVRYQNPVEPAQVAQVLREEVPEVQVNAASGGRDLTLRAPAGVCLGLVDQLKALLGDNRLTESNEYAVGPAVASTLWREALVAMVFSLIGILIYVTWRFEFRFALGAVVAIFHDGLMALGFLMGLFILGQREISLPVVAAILTILGYSVNDTIVQFDRVRENLKIMKQLDLPTIVNLSVNQVLSRTILTSLTVLFTVLSLFLFGGIQLNDFSFVMLVGVVFGTYSTVYIASPIVLLFGRKEAA